MKSFCQLNEDLTRSSFKGYGRLDDPGFAYVLQDKYGENPNPLDFYNYVRKIFMEIRTLMVNAWKAIPEPIAEVPTIKPYSEFGTPVKLDKIIGSLAKTIQKKDFDELNVILYKTANYVQSINEIVPELINALTRFSEDWPEVIEPIELFNKLKEYIQISKIVKFIKSNHFEEQYDCR